MVELFPKWYCISFQIEFEEDIPSENFMYHPIRRGRYVSLYKDTFVAAFQEKVKAHLRSIMSTFVIPDRTSFHGIFAQHNIFYKEGRFWDRDVENSTKSLNDAVFSFFKEEQEKEYGKEDTTEILDDSHIISQYCQKFPSEVPYIESSYFFIREEYNRSILEILNEQYFGKNN